MGKIKLTPAINAGEAVRRDDVSSDETMDAVMTRRTMEQAFSRSSVTPPAGVSSG